VASRRAYLPPVRPIKGQMLALQMDRRRRCCAMSCGCRTRLSGAALDGRLVVGATVEERGFDTSLTAGGMLALLEGAWRGVPSIEELPIAETWVGFRPGSRDDAPMLGPSGIDGLVIATGHHRNGILLTPVSAAVVSAYISWAAAARRWRCPSTPQRFAPGYATAARRGGAMTRLKINGVDEEVAARRSRNCSPRAASTRRRGFSPSRSTARWCAARMGRAALNAGDAVEIVRPLQGG
jgi:hypothetical protein